MVILRSGGTTDLIISHPDNTMANVTNEQLQASIDSLSALIKTNDTKLSNDIDGIKVDIREFKEVTNESDALKEQLLTTQGRVTRLESKNRQLEEKLITQELKTYEKDLMFYNVKDSQHETFTSLKDTIYSVISDDMHIPSQHICSQTNVLGEVRIDTASRLGKYRVGKSRPVIVNFLTKSGRNIVYSRTYTVNLKEPCKVRISERYPTIVKEKRQTQIEKLKSIKATYKDTPKKVVLSKDKILVDGVPQNSDAFIRNPLSHTTPLSINFEKLEHSAEIEEKESTFQAHLLPVQSKDEASAALNSIFQHPELSSATHIMYGYKLGKTGINVESGFSDDDEIGGGSLVMSLIEASNCTNVIVCVTRKKKGPNIGQARFTHIKTCTDELLKAEDHVDPDFNSISFNA